MKILILNWRDPEHPLAGGAEGYLLSVGRRWVEAGHRVEWLSGANQGLDPESELAGIRIRRRGRGWGVFPAAALDYLRRGLGRFDVVVDSENGIPFFSPFYSRLPKVVLVHHVHREVFHRELPKPAAHLATWLEGRLMPFAYRNDTFVAVSESTRRDLLQLGVSEDRLAVVHNGLDGHFRNRTAPEGKASRPTVVSIGRLQRYKCLDTLLRAAALCRGAMPDLRWIIAGDGPDRGRLEALTRELELEDRVEFRGFVDAEEKVRLLQSAHVAVQTSMKEGWGMTVIEANARGTAVVAADVAGLRDSVRHGETGLLVPWNDPSALAEALTHLIEDPATRGRLERQATLWAARFDWSASAERWLRLLEARLESPVVPPSLRFDLHPRTGTPSESMSLVENRHGVSKNDGGPSIPETASNPISGSADADAPSRLLTEHTF